MKRRRKGKKATKGSETSKTSNSQAKEFGLLMADEGQVSHLPFILNLYFNFFFSTYKII